MENLRKYGRKPYTVAVVHGGPGAPGEMAPVARELSSDWGVLEPLQTKDSVDGQVAELYEVLKTNADWPVALVGHSWGAWLSFITSARHPEIVRKLVLVASGPFEPRYAENIVGERLNRLAEAERIEALEIVAKINDAADKDKLMMLLGALFSQADAYDAFPHEDGGLGFSYDINDRVWRQASGMRASGKLLELGRKIRCPVMAIHGDDDPHPAEGVREPLSRVIRDFKFTLLVKCGHEPWRERFARDEFYEILRKEIA